MSSSWLLLLFLPLLSCHNGGFVSAASCPDNQSSLLLKLKNGFSFPNNPRLGSWVAGSDCCFWEGVTCDNATGLINGLDISPSSFENSYERQYRIDGRIDPSLFQLHSLQILDLSWTCFDESHIPSGLGQLTNLTHLKISHACFYGQIPLQISQLTRLISLDLSSNGLQLRLEKPDFKTFLCNLTALQELYMDDVDLSMAGKEWSQTISSYLPHLRVLSMGNCGLSTPFYASLLQLPFLSELHLFENDLSSLSVSSFPKDSSIRLRLLDLSSCSLELGQDQLFDKILQLPNLRTLDLSGQTLPSELFPSFPPNNTITIQFLRVTVNGNLPKSISNLKYLNHVDLSSSFLSGGIPENLGDLKFLNHLDLSDNTLTGGIPEKLGDLKFLNHLDLSSNTLTGGIPEKLGDLKFLNHLDLSSNTLTGGIPEKLGDLKVLNHLDLSHNTLTCGILEKLGDLKVLKFLDLSSNTLTGGIPKKLGDLKVLNHLDLSSNTLTSGIPEELGDLNVLNHLDLSDNTLTGGIPEKLGDLKVLNHLDLSNNTLTGGIPKKLGDLNFLKELVLSSNNLTTCIPFSFGLLLDLTHLSLGNNKLNGEIPPFLFNLPSLQELALGTNLFHGPLSEFTNLSSSSLSHLDLSNNKLSGPIPNSITYLTRLEVLILSSNNFSGTVDLGLFHNLLNLHTLDLSDNIFTVRINNDSIGNTPLFSKLSRLVLRSCNMSEFPWLFTHNQAYLSYLDLSNNRIHGAIPKWIWQFKDLGDLNLSHNLLTSIEEPINLSFSVLVTLDLKSNMLEGSLPIPPFAQNLDYSLNKFASIIPTDIGSYLNETRFLSLSSNKFMGEIPSTVCKGDMLKVLDMSKNNLSGLIPWCLINMTSLSIVNLRENDLRGNIPDSFLETSHLRTLDLNSNRLDGPIPKSLINCTDLEVLDLGNNHLNDTFPFWLENLPHLAVLILGSNQFHGSIKPNQTRHGFQRLQIIDLSTNSFTGNLPMAYFQSLTFMMEGAEVVDDGLEHGFFRFEDGPKDNHLISIYMSYYMMCHREMTCRSFARNPVFITNVYYQDVITLKTKGLEMTFVKILTTLITFDLSNNKFKGRVPKELGNLKYLNALNLSWNNLNGPIPTSLGNLSFVESMDLSHNSLSGEIPTQLARLNFLEVLDLSHNMLTGRIPEGTQFSTFPESSFIGNLGLCGPPLSSNCTRTPTMEPVEGKATDDGMERLEFIVGGIMGFFSGMALVVWPLLFWRKWRRWYYGHVDKALLWISTCVTRRRG